MVQSFESTKGSILGYWKTYIIVTFFAILIECSFSRWKCHVLNPFGQFLNRTDVTLPCLLKMGVEIKFIYMFMWLFCAAFSHFNLLTKEAVEYLSGNINSTCTPSLCWGVIISTHKIWWSAHVRLMHIIPPVFRIWDTLLIFSSILLTITHVTNSLVIDYK